MACAQRYLPPFHRSGIFFFCGLEFAWNAFVMAINQKFWDLSTKIFPTAYKMFNDTLAKGEPRDFVWTEVEYTQLQFYQYKLTCMWLCSTVTILYCMLSIVPQFCTLEQADGTEVTFCVKKPRMSTTNTLIRNRFLGIGYLMAPILLILIVVCGCCVTWQWWSCQEDFDLFQSLFQRAQKEEIFLSELENQLLCITDDDREGVGITWRCDSMISRSMLNRSWMDPILISYFVVHVIMFAGFGVANRHWKTTETSSKTLVEENGKLTIHEKENLI
ncbi:hypothetical protein M3Y98_00642300 [Aphelenchoides besseyi]|nr:hypothetical protein M3Y98_00642300 [Aphelenchoides besseyi]KAI6208582.1 hypothetical protein M3Y96_00130400 [Aphelenchoides besseyi]